MSSRLALYRDIERLANGVQQCAFTVQECAAPLLQLSSSGDDAAVGNVQPAALRR
jgi:hypothetical protein